jgi:drug/metabolite transporter (DMT)-like permease
LGWAALLGWVFFAEAPRAALFAGAAVVVAATLIAQRDERAARVA